MRTPVYAWGDGVMVHLWARESVDPRQAHAFDPEDSYPDFTGGIAIKEEVFDALVLFRMAELVSNPKELKRAVRRAVKEAGNFGSFSFQELLGGDPAGDFAKRMQAIKAELDKKKAGKKK